MKSSTIARVIAAAIVLLFWLFALIATSRAQTSVSGSVAGLGGAACTSGCEVRFELYNCGDNAPKCNGKLIADDFDNGRTKSFTVDESGNISGNICGNDQISCGGITGTTRFLIGVFRNGRLQGVKQKYYVAGSTFNPGTSTPENTDAPSAANDYAIRNGSNEFRGTQDFSNANVIGFAGGSKPRKFIPAESPDGSRTQFTLGAAPPSGLEFQWFWNGQALAELDDYTISGNVITVVRPPKSGDKVWAVF